MSIIIASALALSLVGQTAIAPDKKQVSIPFADHGGLQNWVQGKSDDVLYVQDRYFKWYKVQLSGTCFLTRPTNLDLGYTTSPSGSFDRFSKIFLPSQPGNKCWVTGIEKSGPPPGYGDKHHKGDTKPKP